MISFRVGHHSYTAEMYDLKINGAGYLAIASKLREIENSAMGLEGNADNCKAVAINIENLH